MMRPGSPTDPSADDDARRQAAAAWLVRLDADDVSEADWLAFGAWLGDDDNKRVLDAIEANLAIVDDHLAEFRTKPAPRAARFIGPAFLAALASAAAALLVWQWYNPAVDITEFAAPAEATRSVALADGTLVVLNRGAQVRVRWSAGERHVDLLRGEAAFEVIHNDRIPFTVAAGNALIRDTGTEFNVLRVSAGLIVTLRSGAVHVTSAGHPSLDLTPGDQARLADGHQQIQRVDADAALAWRQGRLVYHNAALSDVAGDLNRYSTTPIVIGDAAAAHLHFSGALQIGTGDAMAAELEAFLPIRSEHNGGTIVLRSRPSRDSSRP